MLVVVLAQTTVQSVETVEYAFLFFDSHESPFFLFVTGQRETQLLGKVGASNNGLSLIIINNFSNLHIGDIKHGSWTRHKR